MYRYADGQTESEKNTIGTERRRRSEARSEKKWKSEKVKRKRERGRKKRGGLVANNVQAYKKNSNPSARITRRH